MPTRAERFWSKVDRRGANDCWEWKASTVNSGYGKFWDGKSLVLAHRYSYLMANGSLSDSVVVCHSCDNKLCVNPDHLWVGTHADNLNDMRAKGRQGDYSHKLTRDVAEEIRRMYSAGGISQAALGKRYGVSQSMVGFIVRGEIWRS